MVRMTMLMMIAFFFFFLADLGCFAHVPAELPHALRLFGRGLPLQHVRTTSGSHPERAQQG